ncbi:MAG: hypothetical protein Q9216_003700 [Gyalolechia sp. 2 TL-2023]
MTDQFFDVGAESRKTEILLEIAFRLRNVTNVFSLKATDAKSLDLALLQIAVSIGHELLSVRFKNADLASIWRGYGPDERIQAFRTWLAHKDNQPNVFIVDDLDALVDDNLIAAALPSQAQVIIYSARDPTIMESLERHGKAFHIPDMAIDEMASLMNATLQRTGSRVSKQAIADLELESIAKIVSGHALGACRAITYILNVLSQTSDKPAAAFIQSFTGSEWEARRQFLEYRPRLGLSVMETFATSLERIKNHKEAAVKLLELMAFLRNNSGSLQARNFFAVERPWLAKLRIHLPDYDTFAQGLSSQNKYLLELERVSIGVRPIVPGPLQIHPLWIECIQQRAERSGRLRWLRQILTLCHFSFVHDPKQYQEVFKAFTVNALMIALRFDISYDDLCENNNIKNWLKNSIPGLGTGSALSIRSKRTSDCSAGSSSSDEDTESPVGPSEVKNDVSSPVPNLYEPQEAGLPILQSAEPQRNDTLPKAISLLHEQCKAAATSISSSNPEKLSEEAFAKQVQTYLGLLRRLKDIEDNTDVQAVAQSHKEVCIDIYDMLIRMAPAFRSRNPMIAELLQGRRDKFMKDMGGVDE